MFKKYRNKINLIGKSINLYLTTNSDDRLKKAEEATEFIHEGKIYNIKTSKLIFKNELDGHNGMLYTILYQTAKKNYFLYIMSRYYDSRNYRVTINTLDIEQAKSWLLEKNVERYKEFFGEIEEA